LQFGIFRFFLGLGEAGNWPAGLKLTGEWFPPHERSTASGIFNSGSALGSIIVPPLVAYLGVNYGWRTTFMVLGISGYLWIAAFWFSYYTPERAIKKERTKIVPPLKLLRTRFISMFILAKIFIEPVWYFVTFWIGRYLVDVHHWDLKKIGWFAAIPFIIADVGNIIGGYFTQFIIKLGIPIPKARKTAIAIAGFLMAASLLSGPWVITSPITALIVFGITGFGYTMYTANALAIPADVVPKNAAASAWGLACIGNGIGGAIFQTLSGRTLKSFSASHDYTFAYNILFIGFGALVIIGILIMLLGMGPFVKNKQLEQYESKA
jgi:ACS family hexuronate transporter-like MFS transporter